MLCTLLGCGDSSVDAGESFAPCSQAVAESDSFVHDGTRFLAPAASGYATSADGLEWEEHDEAIMLKAVLLSVAQILKQPVYLLLMPE